jgi:hypothetical protein
MRRSKRHLYSITLSARPSSEDGTARPSALAVFALIITRICWLLEPADLKSLPLVLDLDQRGYLPRLFQRGTDR